VVKRALKYDDALDTFGVHAVGGTLGAILTGLLADPKINPNLLGAAAQSNGMVEVIQSNTLWIEQLKAMGLTLALSVVATIVIATVVKALIGLRPSLETEDTGLDIVEHGEAGYEG
jgi:Amt family ammonium transporter